MFSFYSDDSYEPINTGPDACTLKKKPAFVPSLNLDNLPEYETSSDEEGEGEGAGEDGEVEEDLTAGALEGKSSHNNQQQQQNPQIMNT